MKIYQLRQSRSSESHKLPTFIYLPLKIHTALCIIFIMMKLLLVIAALVTVANAGPVHERSVAAFGVMVMCEGHLDFEQGLQYNGYGCYCGVGGYGTALDDTDRCCVTHDNCYGDATKPTVGCSTSDTYFISYDYEKVFDAAENCSIQCKAASDYSASDGKAKCKAHMCECDLEGSKCFADKRSSFNPTFVDYPKNTC